MKQFAILFAAVCAMTFMSGQAEAQCRGGGYGGYGGRSSGFGISIGSGYGGGGFGGYGAPVYRQSVYRPVYGGSYGGGFGGYGVPAYRGGGVSIGYGRSYGGGYGGGRGCGY